MGIGVDGDHIAALLQDVSLVVVLVVGGHILQGDGEADGLGSAGLQNFGLVECDQVCGGLLNAAVGIGRIEEDFHDGLAGGITGVGDGDIEGQIAVGLGDLAHLLLEGGVAQAVAEGIDNVLVVIQEAFCGSGLIELVANIDAFHVVDKHGLGGHLHAGGKAEGGGCELIHVVVHEEAEVVVDGGALQVVQPGVNGLAGGIDLAVQDLAQSGEAGLAGAGSVDGAVHIVVLQEAQLHGIVGVDDHNDLAEVVADQLEHLFLAVGQLQVVIALIPVVALIHGVVIDAIEVGVGSELVEALPGAVHHGDHVGGHIGVLAAGTGDDHHCGIREALGVGHHFGGVQVHVGFGQSPVLGPHAHGAALSLVVGVEVHQLLVDLEAGLGQTVQQRGGGVLGVQSTGADTAVDGVGGCPAKDIDLGAAFQGECLVVVLQQGHALAGDDVVVGVGFLNALGTDGAAAGGQVDHGVHGAGQDQIHDDHHCQHEGQPGVAADQLLDRLFQVLDKSQRHGDDDSHSQNHAENDQLILHGVQHIDNVIHVDT